MQKTPLISVIVPIYNVESYLEECVNSILNQTYKNLEIILVDDGSPDNCPSMCDNYQKLDSRIRVIHKINGGLSDARNKGLEIATGEYISFIDSDDFIEKNMYQKMMDSILENNAELCSCSINLVYDDRIERIDNKREILNDNYSVMKSYILDYNIKTPVWDKLYHKSLLNDLYFEKGKYNEDEFFTYILLSRVKKAVVIEDCFYNYRQREKSIMADYSPKRIDSLEAALQRTEFIYKNYPEFYVKAKYDLYIMCICNYKALIKSENLTDENKEKYMEIIEEFLRKQPWKLKEVFKLSFKNALRMILAGKSLKFYFKIIKV